jgi:hypothetical protein
MTSIVISSGHGKYIRAVSGYLDELGAPCCRSDDNLSAADERRCRILRTTKAPIFIS